MSVYAACPPPDADLQSVVTFALSYNGYERLGHEVEALALVVAPVLEALEADGAPPEWAGLDLLRGALFFLQRQSHHWGHVPPEQERRMRLLVEAIRRLDVPLVDDQQQDPAMTRSQVMAAARALCPDHIGEPDPLRDLVSSLGWSTGSHPGRVIAYEALRLTCGVADDPELVALPDTLSAEPSRHQSWRIRRYATLGSLVAAALQSVHLGEELDEVHELLMSSWAGAWPGYVKPVS